jgi:hypothetical protein
MVRGVCVVLVVSACAVAQQPAPLPIRNDAVVPLFELEEAEHGKGTTIDPILLLKGKQILPVPDPCETGPAQTKFTNEYLKPSTSYAVVFGGADAGTVTIKAPSPNSADTFVRLDRAVPIRGLTMALAAPASSITRKKIARRGPTADERRQAETLARLILNKKGVSPSEAERLQVDQLTVIEFVPGIPEIVASVEIPTADKSGMEASLFFTVSVTNDDKSIVWYQHPLSETEAEAVYVVDVIDIDGDGVLEIVARRVFYENYRYEVYQQQEEQWKKSFETEVFGCL